MCLIYFISGEEVMGGNCIDQELEVIVDTTHICCVDPLPFTIFIRNQHNDSLTFLVCFQEIIRTVLGNLDTLQPFFSTHFNVFPCILHNDFINL